jgi:hypothetical protein
MAAARGLISMPQELVRVDGVAHFEQVLAAEVGEGVEHFAFEAFQVFEGDVEEVAGAAGGVEHADVAEVAVEVADFLDGFLFLVLCFELRRRRPGRLSIRRGGAR